MTARRLILLLGFAFPLALVLCVLFAVAVSADNCDLTGAASDCQNTSWTIGSVGAVAGAAVGAAAAMGALGAAAAGSAGGAAGSGGEGDGGAPGDAGTSAGADTPPMDWPGTPLAPPAEDPPPAPVPVGEPGIPLEGEPSQQEDDKGNVDHQAAGTGPGDPVPADSPDVLGPGSGPSIGVTVIVGDGVQIGVSPPYADQGGQAVYDTDKGLDPTRIPDTRGSGVPVGPGSGLWDVTGADTPPPPPPDAASVWYDPGQGKWVPWLGAGAPPPPPAGAPAPPPAPPPANPPAASGGSGGQPPKP